MRYINTADHRLLVAIRMTKKWVTPNQVVDLSAIDIRMLGANGAFMRPATEEEIAKAAPGIPNAPTPVTSGAVTPKPTNDKANRKALKETLGEYTKADLADVAKKLGVEVRSKDNMAAIMKKIMAAAKKAGYAATLKKVNQA